jgi:hypothetical protein
MVEDRPDTNERKPGARLNLRGELRGFLLLYVVFAVFSALVAWQCVQNGAPR